MKKIVSMMIMWGILMLCVTAVKAQDEPEHREGRGKTCMELNLSAEQEQKLKAIRDSFIDRHQDKKVELRQKKFELIKLFREQEPDRRKIDSKLDEILKIESTRQRLMVEEFFEVRRILTPEQARAFTRKTLSVMLKN